MGRDTFSSGDNFRAWIRTIATRVAFNYRRDSATRAKYHAALEPTPDGRYGDATETRDLLDRVLTRLSYPHREILVLRYVEELSLIEIGDLLNLGESAAKMRLLRAREEFWALNQKEA
jgi:RNA polymerase sigma-70 factor, ECF subfamily